ncbi:hypothetical protein H0H92_004182 [Tricholoma furcatifolium]|nr:hypothetical protein H0H92_004182 [Tricholoma furcatifolium]
MKRARPDHDVDDDDDDISLVSRTPSPAPMDVDGDINGYDQYVQGAPREVITVETRIKPTNKGFAMLTKLGWTEGQHLGLSGDGRLDPIPFHIKSDLTGLGKTSQDVRMIETTVSQRRGLDSERQQKETEDQRRAREELVARKSALEDELTSTLKAFYCALCDKQFKNVAQYDEHTNSYAHHHKARFKDMQANARPKAQGEVDKRKEKERKREEKELRKIAAANGIRMAKPPPTSIVSADLTPAASPHVEVNPNPPSTFRKGGWATLGPAASQTPPPRWASVSTHGEPQSDKIPDEAPQPPAVPSNSGPTVAPTFRTAGWTSLDSGSSEASSLAANSSTSTILASGNHASANTSGWSRVPAAVQAATPPSSTLPTPTPAPEPAQQAPTGWQQFRKFGPKRF